VSTKKQVDTSDVDTLDQSRGELHTLTKKGRFLVIRQTIRKRMQATLLRVKIELRRRMHDPVPEVGKWLKSVVGGHIHYFGVPGNRYALAHFRFTVSHLWHHALERRSQKGRVQWERMQRIRQSNTPVLRFEFVMV
jgi:hypothetical protein